MGSKMSDVRTGLFRMSMPSSHREVLRCHLAPALLSGCVLLAAAFVPMERIAFRVCIFRRLTGYPCPTCGWTRGFVSMARGEWLTAMHDCPLSLLLYGIVAGVFLWNAAGIILRRRIGIGPALNCGRKSIVGAALVLFIMIIANWFYRLGMGLD